MVGGKTVDNVQVVPKCLDIFFRRQSWPDFRAPPFPFIPYPFSPCRQEQMMGTNFTSDLDALFFRGFDEQDFLLQGDMCNVDRPVIDSREEQRGRHGSAFTMCNDWELLWILFEMRHPESHVIEAELAEGHVEVHFERGGLVREGGGHIGILRPRAE